MNFHFKRLATLQPTDLEIRQFTVVIGPNNTNKTYLAYTIYALLDAISRTLKPNTLIYQILDDDTILFPCDSINLTLLRDAISENTKRAVANLSEFFQDTGKYIFADSDINLSISEEEIRSAFVKAGKMMHIFRFLNFEVEGIWSEEEQALRIKMTLREETRKNVLPETKEPDRTKEIVSLFSFLLVRQLFPLPFALPAERSALILIYKTLLYQRYRLLRSGRDTLIDEDQTNMFLSKADQVPASFLPKPIEDFLDFLFELDLSSKRRRNRRFRPDSPQEFKKLADLTIKELYSGIQVELRDDESGDTEIVLHLDEKHEMDMHNASTSIKQLTSLVLYLRYRAQPGDLLIIDEPEMNLHPRSQAILVEILAILSNLGVKILLTTHSPFVLAHLNNLIASKKANTPDRLFLKDERAQLSIDEVSAYEVVDHSLKSLKDEEFGISWQSFSDVASDLQNKLFQIYDSIEVE